METNGPLSNNEHARWARFAATPTASPQGPAPITARSNINRTVSRHFDDLLAVRTHADVLNRGVRQVLEAIQVGARGRRQVRQPSYQAQGSLPTRQRLVHRLDSSESLYLGGARNQRLPPPTGARAHPGFGERVRHRG